MGDIAPFNAAVKKVSTGADQREDMQIAMAGIANWETMIQPAPLSVALLGNLMVVACDSKQDFTLTPKTKDPAGQKPKFQYLKYDGFRACLVQLSNEGYSAFNLAHKNMDQIAQLSALIPTDVAESVKLLISGSPDEVKLLLPKMLKRVEESATRCTELAEAVEKKFEGVMDLSGELLEACTSAQGIYGEKLRDTQIALQVVAVNKKSAEETAKFAKEEQERMVKSMGQAEQMFKEAVDSTPKGWDIVGMQVVEGLANFAMSALNGAMTAYTGGMVSARPPAAGAPAAGGAPLPPVQTTPVPKAADPSWAFATPIVTQATSLEDAAQNDSTGKPNWKKTQDPATLFRTVEMYYGSYQKQLLLSPQSDVALRALGICADGIKLAQDLFKQTKTTPGESEAADAAAFATKTAQLLARARQFSVESTMMTNVPPTAGVGPGISSAPPPTDTGGGAAQAAVKNAQFQVTQTKENLNSARDSYNKATDRVVDTNRKLAEVLAEMSKLDMQKIDFETIRQTLKKGIEAIGRLREEWSKLVRFFQMISNLIKVSLNHTVKSFLDTANTGLELGGVSYGSYLKDMLYMQTMQASKISFVVNMIASTYVKISNDHLMDRLAGLGKIMALDVATDGAKIAQIQRDLSSGCDAAMEAIQKEVKAKNAAFNSTIDTKLDKIKENLQNALPAPPKEVQLEQKKVVEDAKKAVEEVKKKEQPVDDWI